MSYSPAILGFDDRELVTVTWKDRTVIGGILGNPAQWAKNKAELDHKQELRDHGIVVLDDHR
jgi:hypothetical protein